VNKFNSNKNANTTAIISKVAQTIIYMKGEITNARTKPYMMCPPRLANAGRCPIG
jgi:hypothetical protein